MARQQSPSWAEIDVEVSVIAKYSHEEYLKQKDNLREAAKRYRHRNGETYYARRREFYAANAERLRAKQREYNAKNKERRGEYAKADAARHFFRVRANNLKIRHEGQETASKVDIARLWHKQHGICPFTGIRLNRYNCQLDHIISVNKGGTGTIENLRWVHKDVNYAKRDLTDNQFVTMCQLVSNRK